MGTPLERFLDLVERSVIVQGLITLAVLLTWLWLIANQLQPPPALNNIVGLVIGFYFGAKSTETIQRNRTQRMAQKKPFSEVTKGANHDQNPI